MELIMKEKTVRRVPVERGRDLAADRERLTEEVVSNTYEVPNSSIAKVSALVGVILTVVQTLSSLVMGWVGEPRSRADVRLGDAEISLVERNFKLQALQRVLEDPDPKSRANSLNLLVASGLLDDPNGKIQGLANKADAVPPWRERPLESLKETLPLVRGGSVPVNSNVNSNGNGNGNQNRNGNSNTNSNTNANTNVNRNINTNS
jgi:hypothetical protein